MQIDQFLIPRVRDDLESLADPITGDLFALIKRNPLDQLRFRGFSLFTTIARPKAVISASLGRR